MCHPIADRASPFIASYCGGIGDSDDDKMSPIRREMSSLQYSIYSLEFTEIWTDLPVALTAPGVDLRMLALV
jgi:hypothetical protein